MTERLFGLSVGMPAPAKQHARIIYAISQNIFADLYENEISHDYELLNGHSISDDLNDFQPDVLLVDADTQEPVLIFEIENSKGFKDQTKTYLEKGARYTDELDAEYFLYVYDKNRWYIFEDGEYMLVPDDTECEFLEQPLSDLLILAEKE